MVNAKLDLPHPAFIGSRSSSSERLEPDIFLHSGEELAQPLPEVSEEDDEIFVGWAFYDQKTGKIVGVSAYSERLVDDSRKTYAERNHLKVWPSAATEAVYPQVWYPVMIHEREDQPDKVELSIGEVQLLFAPSGRLVWSISTLLRIPIYRDPSIFNDVATIICGKITDSVGSAGELSFSLFDLSQTLHHYETELNRILVDQILLTGIPSKLSHVPV